MRPLPHGTNCHGSPGQASRCQTHARPHARAAPRRGGFDTNGISIGNGKAARARLCGNGNETKPRFLYRRASRRQMQSLSETGETGDAGWAPCPPLSSH